MLMVVVTIPMVAAMIKVVNYKKMMTRMLVV